MNIEQAFAELALHTKQFVEKKLNDFSVHLDALIKQAIADIPVPKDGENGVTGTDGKDGENGKDGQDGSPGAPGKDGENGRDGVDGAPGVDGKSVDMAEVETLLEKAVSRETSKWALDFERRAQDLLQKAIDKMPVPKDGRDALDLEDMQVTHDDDGNVTFKFVRGTVEKTFTIRLPRFKDMGVYADTVKYVSGDGVSCGGCFWIAQKDSPEGKPGAGDGWRLAVKKGRDGKDGVMKAEKTGTYKLHGEK